MFHHAVWKISDHKAYFLDGQALACTALPVWYRSKVNSVTAVSQFVSCRPLYVCVSVCVISARIQVLHIVNVLRVNIK